jgi:hypothetical protein
MNTNTDTTTMDRILEQYSDWSFLKVDGFDAAVIGVDETKMRLVYSESK